MACEQSGCNFPEGECSGDCLRALKKARTPPTWRRPVVQRDYFFVDEVAPPQRQGIVAKIAEFFKGVRNGR